jgi:hypothetical protein
MQSGKRLGPYEIVSSIGAGGMGEVYRARDTRLRRDVAIKVLPASFAADEDRLRRFRLEAESASALNHPNILTVYDIGTEGDAPYLVMELLEGESLRERLNGGKLSTARAIDYARQIAAGLGAAHARGIIHRDIKPENLFLTRDGRVKILDFGVAKLSARAAEAGATMTMGTSAGTVVGTAAYMSPEQARGRALDHRTDIFSFGCVLYEMVTGERAFAGSTQADTVTALLTCEPELNRIPSPALQRTIAHCLEKEPERRFDSAQDLAFSLEAVTQGSGPAPAAAPPRRNWTLTAVAAAALVLAAACAVLGYLAFRAKPAPSFDRLTFRRGQIHAARFTPDGNGVVYSAAWEDEPSEVFSTRFDSPGARPLGFPGSQLRAVSPMGELALAQKTHVRGEPFAPVGLLATAPLSGGAARPREDSVNFFDWPAQAGAPALARESDQGSQLEYPPGKVLYRTAGYISDPRISPNGELVAFLDHPLANDNAGTVAVVDRAGTRRTLTHRYLASQGLAWHPSGREIWFTATNNGAKSDLRAVTLAGRDRLVYSAPVNMLLHDIAKDGRVLISTEQARMKLMFRGASDARERELSWLDWSLLSSMSRDGKTMAFFESGEGAGAMPIAYLRDTSGAAAAVMLGPGNFPVISMDGQSVVTVEAGGAAVVIYPVGPGQARRIPVAAFTINGAGLLPDGKRLWLNASEAGHGARYYLLSVEGGRPRPVTPEAVRESPPGLVLDGNFLAGRTEGRTVLYPVDGGPPQPLEGVSSEERIAGSSPDGQSMFIYARNQLPAVVWRVNRRTGKREPIREIAPIDRAGMEPGINTISVAADGKAFGYSFLQMLSELQLAEGLR